MESVYRTFQLSEKVNVSRVNYKNRYGIRIAADLYVSKNLNFSLKHAAIIVGTPYGGVKEQGAGIYAQNMAERGFVALAFDQSFNGDSGGEPRRVSSPDIFVEDFSAAVDYLGSQTYVNRDQIGVIGICGSGGFSIAAAQVDRRIKAIVTTSMYDITRVASFGWKDSMGKAQRNELIDELNQQRWNDFTHQTYELSPSFPSEPVEVIPGDLNPIAAEFFSYYAMKRGFHPNSIGAFTKTSALSFMNFSLMTHLKSLSPRPILFVIGEHAHSRYFSEDAFELASEPKELYVVTNANHIDLYDRTDLIPFEKISNFFNQYLLR